MRTISYLFPLLLVVLISCGDRPDQGATVTDDSARRGDSLTPSMLDTMPVEARVNPATVKNFDSVVFREYAGKGVLLPKALKDSISALRDPRKIQEAHERVMARHDTMVRRSIAEKYGITVDSLSKIIEERNR